MVTVKVCGGARLQEEAKRQGHRVGIAQTWAPVPLLTLTDWTRKTRTREGQSSGNYLLLSVTRPAHETFQATRPLSESSACCRLNKGPGLKCMTRPRLGGPFLCSALGPQPTPHQMPPSLPTPPAAPAELP